MNRMTPSVEHLTALLDELGTLAREESSGGTPNLGAAVGVVDEVGQLITRGTQLDIRHTQASIGALRDRLDGDGVEKSPALALAGKSSHAYLAGAMWALSEAIGARLDIASARSDGVEHPTRKGKVREMVLAELAPGIPTSPSALLKTLSETVSDIRRDEISRSLGDLLADDLVKSVPATRGTDRRVKYFVLADRTGQDA